MSESGPSAQSRALEAWRVEDDVLAHAYASISDQERSWIKKNIAQLYALYVPDGQSRASTRTRWVGGFATTTRRTPRPWCCLLSVLTDPSPAQIVAALIPMMTAGIQNIQAILHPSAAHSPLVLTSLELCGVEDIAVVPPESLLEGVSRIPPDAAAHVDPNGLPGTPSDTFADTPAHSYPDGLTLLLPALVAEEPEGVILNLDGPAWHGRLSAATRHQALVWSPRPAASIRIWCDAPDQWNWPVLEWNHPRTRIEAWGPCRTEAPPHIPQSAESWDAFLHPDGSVLATATHLLHGQDIPQAGLLLTPGQEGCWYWPDLHPAALGWCCGMALADAR